MKSNNLALKLSGLLGMAAASVFLMEVPAQALTTLNLVPGDFSDQSSGGVIDSASVNSDPNTTAPPNGFGGFFQADTTDTLYLLLGAVEGQTISGSDSSGNSSALSTGSGLEAELGGIFTVSFDWAFRGNAGTGNDLDSFTVTLANITTSTTFDFFTRDSATGYGQDSESISFNVVSSPSNANEITPGTYQLFLDLNERNTLFGGNSAAGFDNIELASQPATAIPFNFSPSLGLLLLGGLWGGSHWLKHKAK